MIHSIPPLYPYSGYKFNFKKKSLLYLLDSGRSALLLAVNILKAKYDKLIFLLPAYTCHSVIDVMEQSMVKYNFVDVDSSLQFDKKDLELMLEFYKDNTIVLIATSLFGVKLKNYKKMYPTIKVIEDLSHSLISYKYKESDFAFTSFGKGKMISAWSGGALSGFNNEIDEYYLKLPHVNNFFFSFILVQMQKIVSKYFWFLLEGTRYNPEKKSQHYIEKIVIKRLNKIKSAWIYGSLESFDYSTNKEFILKYKNEICKEYQFDLIGLMPYIRFPVKKKIFMSGVSQISSYAATYYKATKRRSSSLSGAKLLAEGVSFLPTHNLVKEEYLREIIQNVNT